MKSFYKQKMSRVIHLKKLVSAIFADSLCLKLVILKNVRIFPVISFGIQLKVFWLEKKISFLYHFTLFVFSQG